MDTAALEIQATANRRGGASRLVDLMMSAVLCVLLPIAFWLVLISAGVWLATDVMPTVFTQAIIAAGMAVVLVPVWASLFVTKKN